MAKKNYSRSDKKIGLPPGALVYTGAPKEGDTGITLISYNQDSAQSFTLKNFTETNSKFQKDLVNWINFDSLHNTSLIEEAGLWANIHSLLLEDILDVSHQPKIEEYKNFLFFTLKMLEVSKDGNNYGYDHVSFVLGKNYLFSFQEHKGDPLTPFVKGLLRLKGKSGAGQPIIFFPVFSVGTP